MQRLHAPSEELRDVGQLLDARYVVPDLRDGVGRSAARHELEAELDETGGELVEAGLVVAGDKGSLSDGLA
jgi:hypothetical protein